MNLYKASYTDSEGCGNLMGAKIIAKDFADAIRKADMFGADYVEAARESKDKNDRPPKKYRVMVEEIRLVETDIDVL